MPPEETLELERLAPLLSGQIKREGERVGWQYRFDPINRERLSKKVSAIWQPDEIGDHEFFAIVTNIANSGELDIRDQDLRDYAAKSGFDLNEVIDRLVERRVLAWRRENVLCVVEDRTILTMFLPDGRVVSTSDGDMLNLWME
jgi:hypothetical protein